MNTGAQIAIRQPEYCPHSLDIGIAICHRCDGTAVYTEAQLQQEIAKARIDEWNRLISITRINGERVINQATYSLALDRIAELSQTLKNES